MTIIYIKSYIKAIFNEKARIYVYKVKGTSIELEQYKRQQGISYREGDYNEPLFFTLKWRGLEDNLSLDDIRPK